jgi:hypothetical protein
MRESCMYGSERGARGNSRPYRTRREFISLLGARLMPSSKLWRVRVQPMAPGDKAAGEQALAEVTPFWQ